MELGTREILLVLGLVVIAGILLDGLRRVRRTRRESLVEARRNAVFDDESIDELPSELPTGQVRIVSRDEREALALQEEIRRRRQGVERRHLAASGDQGGGGGTVVHFTPPRRPGEPALRASEEEEEEPVGADRPGASRAEAPREEKPRPAPGQRATSVGAEPPADDPTEKAPQGGGRRPFWEEESPPPRAERCEERQTVPEDVVVLHVMARDGGRFQGNALLEAFLAHDLRFGARQIFHRHEQPEGRGPVLFSVANCLNPGTFDLAAMDHFETPGVTFIMPLQGLADPMKAYRELVRTARSLGQVLGGVVLDETRSALTPQTEEHYRQQIIEFTRRSFTLTH
ncbi:MAG: hypothetical protein KatS3mg124_0876 [Porticoccaceae bacterium]|nr:MAG: hypothetical protein KatS3mg124_0876 [Porticoccaceae bacterium]